MATLGDDLDADLQAAISDYGQSFIYRETSYPCVLSSHTSSLVVSKAVFPARKYPRFGDVITVTGKVCAVKGLNNSMSFLAAGGVVEDRPFIDDPNQPALIIEFGNVMTH
jgi:hypothetical protein